MATIHRFEDLNAWKKARELAKAIFEVTRHKPLANDYDLVRQIRRASGSVMDNIAEGFGRAGRGEFRQFLGIAKGSVTEVKSQLYRATDCQYITADAFQVLYGQADETAKIISGLISYLNETEIKGQRYAHEPDVIYHSQCGETENEKLKTEN